LHGLMQRAVVLRDVEVTVKTAIGLYKESFDDRNEGQNSLQNTSKTSTVILPIIIL